ncbi:MAG: PilN domain-containing protein [Gemmatimonadota bacterium]|nr:MAG: PilN domain-containing protein [Gemmatimonadota bacterium]
MKLLEFNLLPEEFRRPEKVVRFRIWGVVIVVATAVLVGFLILIYTGQRRTLDNLNARIGSAQSDIAKLQESVRLTREVDELKTGISQNIRAINAVANQNAERVAVLQQINACVSHELALISLEEQALGTGYGYLITGHATSNLAVVRFIDSLKDSEKFQRVTLTYIRPTQVDGEYVLSFEINAVVTLSASGT